MIRLRVPHPRRQNLVIVVILAEAVFPQIVGKAISLPMIVIIPDVIIAGGDYRLLVIGPPATPTFRSYRLPLGLNAPQVATGQDTPGSESIAFLGGAAYRPSCHLDLPVGLFGVV